MRVDQNEGNQAKFGPRALSSSYPALKRAFMSFYELSVWELIVSFTLRGTTRKPTGGQNATRNGQLSKASRHICDFG